MNKVVIGLEIHIQLVTKTKMFCSCSAKYGDTPNTNICPVCLGYPGTLPQLNESAVMMGIRLGFATNGTISLNSDFSRKNYFYPDLPKGYQVTQFNIPLVQDGYLDVQGRNIRINRIHLEEDSAKMFHGNRRSETLIDFNRAGMPLLEVVTEPDIENEKEAEEFLKKLHRLIKFLGISTGKMEEGALRCDVNVSMTKDDGSYGTKVEIKNLNSFKSVTRAIQYEMNRQSMYIKNGIPIESETRSFDEETDSTFSMRIKPSANDYRYFLDPDLGQLSLDTLYLQEIQKKLPELPEEAMSRLTDKLDLTVPEASLLVNDENLLHFFDQCYLLYPNAKIIINWISTEILGNLNKNNISLKNSSLTPDNFVILLKKIDEEQISGKMGKSILIEMMSHTTDPKQFFFDFNQTQESDENYLLAKIQEMLKNHEKEILEFKAGKTNILEMFMGEIMNMTDGNANPSLLKKLLTQKLAEIP
jgi:aspartyl-tRNA(Asn)/glutamyl-tRNA(Gln) amidotransferase subunit B